ncbi:MAG: hypothetical protein JWO06_3659 [Bacteroidota bacterium]|nr:hypothetical protein [Bacteroidota bacterium]
MAKEKPKEILELEKELYINLEEVPYQPIAGEFINHKLSFSTDNEGNIISLRLDGVHDVELSMLSKFYRLKELTLNYSNVGNIAWIASLISLEQLGLYRSKVVDFTPISPLINLKVLWLSDSAMIQSNVLSKLSALESLIIIKMDLADTDFLKTMTRLRNLYLCDCHLSNIESLVHLQKLEIFVAWNNHLTDITFLSGVKSLKKIFLQKNSIEDITPLTSLPDLSVVNLDENNIFDIPAKLFTTNPKLSLVNGRDASKNEITILDNPLTSPPYSIIELGMPAIRAYFENKEKYNTYPLNEGRIILVGDGSAGKSSLMDRILYNSFDKDKPQTDGIKIEQWHLKKDERDLRFNMWDFGGQEIQHAVHKFFFTSGCLYILVLDNRKEEEPEYWLQQIETLGGGASVMVIFNKTDQNLTETVDRKFLKEKYPNIIGFFNVSCKTGSGLQDFQKVLEEQAPRLNTVDDQFPGNWFSIKNEIEAATGKTSHYLVYDAYVEICKRHGVADEQTQKLLLKYFSFIGAVTWFGENSAYLQHMHVLNPAWITQGVYRIVTAKKTELLKGQIKINDFKELLQPTNSGDFEYNENHYGYILALMEKFELCYRENDIELLIPSRFSKEPKIEYSEFKGEDVRTYILQFKDYLPVAVIHQFIVRNIRRAFDKNYWYQGIVIQDESNGIKAMVQLDREAKRIYIRVKGDYAIGIWESVREHFQTICNRYARLSYSEQVAVSFNELENVVEYQDLINHLKVKRKKFFHPKLMQEFDVSYLIGLFEPKEKTLEKFENSDAFPIFDLEGHEIGVSGTRASRQNLIYIEQILNTNTQVNNSVEINIDIQLTNNLSHAIKDETNYLLGEIKDENQALKDALQKALNFAEEAAKAKNTEELKGKGWGRKLKQVMETIKLGADVLKGIPDGVDAGHKIVHALTELAQYFHIIVAAAS